MNKGHFQGRSGLSPEGVGTCPQGRCCPQRTLGPVPMRNVLIHGVHGRGMDGWGERRVSQMAR